MVLNEVHDADPVSMTEAIAHFAVGTPSDDIPDSARHILRLSLLDWVAVAIAGKDEPVSRIVRQLVADEAGTPEATGIGHDIKLPARAAALANGAAAHALDYDDTHFVHLGHPSAVVMSATLAMAEKLSAKDRDVIDAALIGVETGLPDRRLARPRALPARVPSDRDNGEFRRGHGSGPVARPR